MSKTYDPRKVRLFFQGHEVTGFTESGFVRVAATDQQPYDIGPHSWTITGTMRPIAAGPRRYSGRGGGLIPDSAFSERQGPRRPTTERTHAPENEERGSERTAPGCYHKRPVRYDGPEEDES